MIFVIPVHLNNKSRPKLPLKPIQKGHLAQLLFLVFGTLFFLNNTFGQGLVINEFMSDNESTITDQDGHFVDWLELYNSSEETINLGGYQLSDDATKGDKWTFPEIEIEANGFLIIYASGKNLSGPELHTNFKISALGEKLLLSDESGNIIDQWNAVTLLPDQSYGRMPDGGEVRLTYDQSTPQVSNELVNQMILSKPSGFYTEEFMLHVISLLGDSMYYTLDGSVPTMASELYTGPISIMNRNSSPNVLSEIPSAVGDFWLSPEETISKGTILRLASYKNGLLSSPIVSRTYFVNEESTLSNLPVISLVLEEESLFDHDTGIYVQGVHFDPESPLWTGNYYKKGMDWERDVHIEYFDEDGTMEFAQDAGIRVHGGGTRRHSQKSLRLTARTAYGRKYFYHPLFEERDCDKYREFLLKTSMASWRAETVLNDAYAASLVEGLNFESLHQRPVVVYINGEYWGIHYLSERISDKYLEYISGTDEDSLDIIAGNYELVVKGSSTEYTNMLDYIENNDLSQAVHFQYVESQMDMNSYIDYQISEIFLKNVDWPGNNMKLWQPQDSSGRWRWIFYDLDAGFGPPTYDMLTHAVTKSGAEPKKSTFLFQELLKNQDFKNRFTMRYGELLDNQFSYDALSSKLEKQIDAISEELPNHVKRWTYPLDVAQWEEDVRFEITNFIEERGCYAEQNLIDFMELTEYRFPCHQTANSNNDDELVVLPNPNRGEFQLHNNGADDLQGDLRIYTLQGELVYERGKTELNSGQKLPVTGIHLEAGTYLVQFIGAKIICAKMIVINGLNY